MRASVQLGASLAGKLSSDSNSMTSSARSDFRVSRDFAEGRALRFAMVRLFAG